MTRGPTWRSSRACRRRVAATRRPPDRSRRSPLLPGAPPQARGRSPRVQPEQMASRLQNRQGASRRLNAPVSGPDLRKLGVDKNSSVRLARADDQSSSAGIRGADVHPTSSTAVASYLTGPRVDVRASCSPLVRHSKVTAAPIRPSRSPPTKHSANISVGRRTVSPSGGRDFLFSSKASSRWKPASSSYL